MSKEIIKNNFEEMKMDQAIKMLIELFKEIDMNDKNTVFFKDLMQVLDREYISLNKSHIRWRLVEDDLTKKQTKKLIDEL